MPADVGATVSADAALVGLLAVIFSPWTSSEARRQALEQPLLRDRRAAGPLSYLLDDHDAGVRAAAARMLGRLPISPPLDPRIEQALLQTARMRTERLDVRIAAIEALTDIGGPASATALHELYTSRDEPKEIRDASRIALAARWPAELAKKVSLADDRSGRRTLIAGSALLGSYTLGAVGALGRNEAGTVIGVLGGAVTGAVTATYLTRSGEITQAQGSWLVSAGMWGAALGMSTAASFVRDPDHRFVLALGLLGESAGLGAAFATRRGLRYSASDVKEINAAGLLAVDLALGGLLAATPDSPRTWSGVLTAAGVAGLATGLALAPELEFSERDSGLIALTGYEGLWLGSLAPTAWFSPVEQEEHHAAGTLLGAGLGIVAGAALAQHTELEGKKLGAMWLFGSYGKLLGYSVPLLSFHDSTAKGDSRGVFLGSLAGLAGGVLARDIEITSGDAGLIALGTVVGGWHGLGLGIAADVPDRKLGGLVTLGTSAGGLGSIGLSQLVKLQTSDVQALTGGLFWGTWFSAWGAVLADMELEPAMRMTVFSGDAGLAIGGLLVSPSVDIDPRRIGVAYLGGLSGAALFSLGAALFTRDNDTLIQANLGGSALGLAVGGVVANQMTFSPRVRRGARRAPPASGGLSLRAPLLSPIVLPPPPGTDALPGIGIGATFLE